MEVGERILRSSFMFSARDFITPVMVVAIKGYANDWAAYIAGVPVDTSTEDAEAMDLVARSGCKLPEPVARAFFPTVSLEYRS